MDWLIHSRDGLLLLSGLAAFLAFFGVVMLVTAFSSKRPKQKRSSAQKNEFGYYSEDLYSAR